MRRLLSQKPSVEINAPSTVKKNARGPNTTVPPKAKPPVVKNNTKNPKNAMSNESTPCTPIHANASTPRLDENKIARTKNEAPNARIMKAMIMAAVVFHSYTTSWNGIQMNQQHKALIASIGIVNHKVIGL